MVVNSAFVDVKFVKKVQVFLLLPQRQFALHQMLRVLALYYCRPSMCPFPLLRHISPITPGSLSNWPINFTMGNRFIVNRRGMSRRVHVVYGVIISVFLPCCIMFLAMNQAHNNELGRFFWPRQPFSIATDNFNRALNPFYGAH